MGFITELRETIRAKPFVFFSGPTNVIRTLYQWSNVLLCSFHHCNELLMNLLSTDESFYQLSHVRLTVKFFVFFSFISAVKPEYI